MSSYKILEPLKQPPGVRKRPLYLQSYLNWFELSTSWVFICTWDYHSPSCLCLCGHCTGPLCSNVFVVKLFGGSACHLFIYLFIFYFWLCWVFGSCEGFLLLRQAGATLHRGAGTALHRGARAPLHRGPSRRGAQAPDAQAQQSWLTGPAAPRHVGSSQTRARTRVPRISRQILNHCATREALCLPFNELISWSYICL